MTNKKFNRRIKRKVARLIVRALRTLPPEKALRLLFGLENWLAFFQTQIAIAYGDGVHPKHRLTQYHDFFVQRIEAGERVLDIGCGIGAVAYDVAEKAGATVVGIDIDPENIKQAHKRFTHPRIDFHVGDALESIPEGKFEVTILSNVLEHFPERPKYLRRVIQSSSAERILIRVPTFERDWSVPLRRELGLNWHMDPTHYTEYTLESFDEEMASAGLEIVHQEVRWGEIWAETMPISKIPDLHDP